MASSFAISRGHVIYGLCLPLAVVLGYLLADPMDFESIAVVLLVLGVLCVPLLMRWHHPLLIFAWNASINPYFLPGRPYLWMILSVLGLLFAILNRSSSAQYQFVHVTSISRSLLFLLAVVVITGLLRGGLGVRSLGSTNFGGRGYFYIIAAVAGYFALTSQRIPAQRAGLYVSVFFLSGLTALVSNLAFLAGSHLDFLYYLFPPELATEQAVANLAVNVQFVRIVGLSFASVALLCWLLARYGLRGILDWTKPHRGALLLLALACCLLSGFRSVLGLFGLILAAQFCFEGLFKPRFLLIFGGVGLVAGALLLSQASRLPLVVQRTISFLPVEVSPFIRQSVEGSSRWRFEMWRELLPEIAPHLLQGKGYSIDPGELDFAFQNSARGTGKEFGWAIIAGDYHNGPLSVIIPFGLWGFLGFIWFLAASLRFLYGNYLRGDPALASINTFILAYFIARVLFFMLVFGGLYLDLYIFTGLVGLSASLNGAELRRPQTAETRPARLVLYQRPGMIYRP